MHRHGICTQNFERRRGKVQILAPLAAASLCFCGCHAFDQVGNSTSAIDANSAAVRKSTETISANRVAVDGSSRSIQSNSLAVAGSTKAISDNRTMVEQSSQAIAANKSAVALSSQAIETNQAAVGDSTAAISSNTVAVNGSSQAIDENRAAVQQSTAAIKENAQALDDMLGFTKKLKENKVLTTLLITFLVALLVMPSIFTLIILRNVKIMVDSHFWSAKSGQPAGPDPVENRK